MNAIYVLSAGLEYFFAVISVILLIGCLFDSNRIRKTNQIFIAILITNIAMNVIDAGIWLWIDDPDYLWLMKVLCFISYELGSLIFALFSYFLILYIREYTPVPQWISKVVVLLGVLMTGLWLLSMTNDMYYYWDAEGICHVGNLFFISQVFGIVFLVGNIVLVLVYRKILGKRESTVLILYSLFPLFSFLVSFVLEWEATPLYAAATISLLLYYTIIHVEHGQRVAEQETQIMRQELELEVSRTSIMMSQIKPHFLFNSLTAIAMLCERDPKKAKETIISFSGYLRENMASLDLKTAIPFTRALEHMQVYLDIEKIRFGEMLHVVYDIQTENFCIPALTLQPIVENAVKHGICKKEEGGTLTVSTREEDSDVLLIVSDDGVGFDPSQSPSDGREHIGLANVRDRLRILVNGTIDIQSEIGKGTTVTLRIPKEINI